MTDYMDELEMQMLAAIRQLDAAVEAVTTAGHTAHNAGDKNSQHTLEETAFALMQQRAKLAEEYTMRVLFNCAEEGESK